MDPLRPPDEELDERAELPAPLLSALRRLGEPPEAPPELDRAVLEAAAPALARARVRRRRRIALVGLPLAAAAAAALFLLVPRAFEARHEAPHLGALEDLDRSGRVDVLDAFRLARELERGTAPRGADFTRDGRVDRDDVEHLARLAVRIDA